MEKRMSDLIEVQYIVRAGGYTTCCTDAIRLDEMVRDAAGRKWDIAITVNVIRKPCVTAVDKIVTGLHQ